MVRCVGCCNAGCNCFGKGVCSQSVSDAGEHTMSTQSDHTWLTDHTAAALPGGLSADEQARFDAHAAQCADCAAELSAARETEQTMMNLFAATRPMPGLEDRLIGGLRAARNEARIEDRRAQRMKISPIVQRAAVAAAAVIVLGGFGYVAQQRLVDGTMPGSQVWVADGPTRRLNAARDLGQIGQAVLTYSNESRAYNRSFTNDVTP